MDRFRAVSRVGSVREQEAVKHYLEALESADSEEELVIEPGKVAEALEKRRAHKEPEAPLHARHEWCQSACLQWAGCGR